MAGFSIPDESEAAFAPQARLFQTDLDALVAALTGTGVVEGCAVTAQGTPDMTVAVAAGVVQSGMARLAVTSGNVTIGAADGSNPRLDAVVATSAGAKAVRAGTAAANPLLPALTAGDVLLARVYVPATDTTIAADQIIDGRLFLPHGIDCTPVSISTTTTITAIHRTVKVDCTAGAVTCNLPTAVGIKGRRYWFKKMDVGLNNVTLDPSGSETVDGQTTLSFNIQYQCIGIESDDANWIIF
jgi:hypothetical protein